jgi:transposase
MLLTRQYFNQIHMKCAIELRMETTGTRKLRPEVQEQLRKQVVRLRKAGKTYQEIGEVVGVRFADACKMFKAYEKDGQSAIKAKKRGRITGDCRTLDPEQENRLKKAITDKTPDQLKFPFDLWTRRAVQQLIQQLFSVNMPTIRLNAKKERVNLISLITNPGKVRFMICNETMNSQTFIQFFKRLIKDAEKKGNFDFGQFACSS